MRRIEAAASPRVSRPRGASLALGCLALLGLAGCETTLAPGAEKVRITTNPKDVEGCRAVGSVDARGPFGAPDDWQRELQNQALGIGADVVFRTSPLVGTDHVTGVAYRCEPPKS